MGKKMEEINSISLEFIEKQNIFFVGTSGIESKINVSPKGMDTLRVLNSKRVIWLNLTGSGNETAAHLIENNRITVMFCAFEGNPLILRIYGKAKIIHKTDDRWKELFSYFSNIPGARQIIDIDVEMVQHSCGFGVPLYDYKGERNTLIEWAEKKGDAGIEEYQKEKNSISIDGKSTGIPSI